MTLPGGYKSESSDIQATDSAIGRGALNGYRGYRNVLGAQCFPILVPLGR